MIKLTTPTGQKHLIAPAAIARITVAGVSSQWHGTRSYVKLFDGEIIECSETVDAIEKQMKEQQ